MMGTWVLYTSQYKGPRFSFSSLPETGLDSSLLVLAGVFHDHRQKVTKRFFPVFEANFTKMKSQGKLGHSGYLNNNK